MSSENYIIVDGNVVITTSIAALTAATQFLPALLSGEIKTVNAESKFDKKEIKSAITNSKEQVQVLSESVTDTLSFVRDAQLRNLGASYVANCRFKIGSNKVAFSESEYSDYTHKLEKLSGIANKTILYSAKSSKVLGSLFLNPKLDVEIETLVESVSNIMNCYGGSKLFANSFCKSCQLLLSFLDSLDLSVNEIPEFKN